MKQVVVLAHELSKSYQVGTQVISVLHKVQASFMAGSSYAITGASGSGKSTLLHLLAGLDAPDSGTIERIVERFGILFQMPYLIDELSVMENIELQGLVAGMAKKEAREQTAKLLAQVGLQGLEDRRPSSLSGGQQHRASLVRALIGQPRLIFADEPTGNLDAETGTLILNLLLYYQQQHDACLIISTHDTSIMQAVDHVLRLENGILQQER